MNRTALDNAERNMRSAARGNSARGVTARDDGSVRICGRVNREDRWSIRVMIEGCPVLLAKDRVHSLNIGPTSGSTGRYACVGVHFTYARELGLVW